MMYADHMFSGAASYTGLGIENWDTQKLISAHGMFEDTHMFTGKITYWNVTACEDFGKLFYRSDYNYLHTTSVFTHHTGSRIYLSLYREYVLQEQYVQRKPLLGYAKRKRYLVYVR